MRVDRNDLQRIAMLMWVAIGLACALPAHGKVVYQHAPVGMGVVHSNVVIDAQGSDQDVTAYDNFVLKRTCRITSITWRGNASDKNSKGFAVKIYSAKPDPSRQPDIDNPLLTLDVAGDAGEKPVSNNLSDYRANLTEPLVLEGGVTYWISIVSKRNNLSPWGWVSGKGGDGKSIQAFSEFKVLPAPGDRAFSLNGDDAHVRKH